MSDFMYHFTEYGVLYLVLSPFIAIVSFFIIRSILKYRKGSIEISILQKNYNYNDTIKGSFRLHAKQIIQGEDLSVHLICLKKESSYSNGKRRTKWVEFTRFSQHIESGVTYDIGLRREYEIKIKIPSQQEIFGDSKIPDFGDSMFANAAEYILRQSSKNKYSWKILIELQAEGVDLSAKKSIAITGKIGIDMEDSTPKD